MPKTCLKDDKAMQTYEHDKILGLKAWVSDLDKTGLSKCTTCILCYLPLFVPIINLSFVLSSFFFVLLMSQMGGVSVKICLLVGNNSWSSRIASFLRNSVGNALMAAFFNLSLPVNSYIPRLPRPSYSYINYSQLCNAQFASLGQRSNESEHALLRVSCIKGHWVI